MHDAPDHWMRGFEIELMAPVGSSRETLALHLAKELDGTVRRVFYPQSEISTTSGVRGYETLTLGFRVIDANGRTFAVLADDITLNDDIQHDIDGAPGWYRILSEQKVTLDLIERVCSAEATIDDVLLPLAELYDAPVMRREHGMRAVRSKSAPLAMAFPLAGDRERACEVISPPLAGDPAFLRSYLSKALGVAKELGFFVPRESATHVHFDAKPLRDVRVIRNLVCIFMRFADVLKDVCATNPACTRLGPWPKDFVELVLSSRFLGLDWPDAARAMHETSVAKWCDFNVLNLFDPFATKRTFEVRILGTTFDADTLVAHSMLFEKLLCAAVRSAPLSPGVAESVDDEGHARLEKFADDGVWST